MGYVINNAKGLTSLFIDADGNGVADYEITIKGTTALMTEDFTGAVFV